MKKTVILKFEMEENEQNYELDCILKATAAQSAIYDALQRIRNRLKYESDDVSEKEQSILEEIRSILNDVVVEG